MNEPIKHASCGLQSSKHVPDDNRKKRIAHAIYSKGMMHRTLALQLSITFLSESRQIIKYKSIEIFSQKKTARCFSMG